jgi:coenzyme PQQ synthesis protein D (PqqD)
VREFPIARQKDLIIEELSDEVLVYDLNTDNAHCLNRTSALIWKNCDGQKSRGDIAELLEQELNSPVSVQVVVLGLEELGRYDLLQNETLEAPKARLSRRRLIQNLGLTAAVSLPLIMSISAPTAAQQGSLPPDPCIANPRADGCPCTFDSDCDGDNCAAGICQSLRPSKRR